MVIGNVMYIVSPYSQAIALNATTGEVIWKWATFPKTTFPHPRRAALPIGRAATACRPRSSSAAVRGRLYSLRASDGKPNTAFGENGIVNLKTPEVMQNGMKRWLHPAVATRCL